MDWFYSHGGPARLSYSCAYLQSKSGKPTTKLLALGSPVLLGVARAPVTRAIKANDNGKGPAKI